MSVSFSSNIDFDVIMQHTTTVDQTELAMGSSHLTYT